MSLKLCTFSVRAAVVTGALLACGACADAGADAESSAAPIAFEVDASPGPVQRGTLLLSDTSVTSGDTVVVTGSGWAPHATVQVHLCSAPNRFICAPQSPVHVAPDGTFTTNVPVTSLIVEDGVLGTDSGALADCAVSNTCSIQAADERDLAATLVSAPLAIAVRPGVSAAFDLRAPHVAEMSVRVVGSGFTPNDSVDLWQCDEVIGIGPLCRRIATLATDASGAVRGYAKPLRGFLIFFGVECERPGSTCDLVVTDGPAVATIPVRFTLGEEFDVTSNYEAKWQPLLEQGFAVSGVAPAELQRQGASVLLWVLAASGAPTAAHFPATGALSYTTTYPRVTTYPRLTYMEMTDLAASYDYTLDELQKAGTLFWSWVLAGQPPLPTRE